jgi:hypothetical protein
MSDALKEALIGWPDGGFDAASPHAWAFRDLWSARFIGSDGLLTDTGRKNKRLAKKS